ncbi:threonine-phosphate decarboxylase CobD [Thalassospira sp.]|uniref:threonine-phosphate decarboxylase CobD n=1 Tax=Thalassospira sp. TaxID=1912094 RepID=UPI000C5ED8C2|nr:threonine-phosphate decarboxylase CobD [Thalassospira sp.]MBC07725.1 threonine-phosphate decarboxylase [Thalassospira sp.]|tara:strand:+ start:255 stop:1349 length:1095 start_codon:yes stop_codon:yes gene_type:complete
MTNKPIPPTEQSPISHGGAVDRAANRYGIPAKEWLDLSTGINPIAYPVPKIDSTHWQRLPLTSELEDLKAAAKQYYGLPTSAHLVAAPGTQALIQTIPFWLKDRSGGQAGTVNVMGPTYGEHERCWRRAGYDCDIHQTDPADRITHATSILQAAAPGAVVILVNPNNPDGALFAPSDIVELGKLAHARNCWLLVDEAFMDCKPDQSVCSQIDQMPSTIILRSFGKFFGLAGARLGCAVMAVDLASDLENRIGPWAIPGPTLVVGTTALLDQDWQEDARARLSSDAERLDRIISENSQLVLTGGTSLFRYYEGSDCDALADHLGKQGILVRLFDHDPNKVRFGLPGHERDWDRLEKAMTDWKQAG